MDYNINERRARTIPPPCLQVTPTIKVYAHPEDDTMCLDIYTKDTGKLLITLELSKAQADTLAEWMNYYEF